jgi:Raf kinase inhibitor-like YbhB/YbcL family protein
MIPGHWRRLCFCFPAVIGLTALVRADNAFTISAPAFAPGQPMPGKFSLRHENVSPQLRVENIPAKTLTLALIVDDPDSPSGLWTHWLVWNLPASLKSIPEGKLPAGAVAGKNSFGDAYYEGPSPPSGTHRYFFHLYALDRVVNLPTGSERAALLKAMEGHVIGKAEMFGTFTAGQ